MAYSYSAKQVIGIRVNQDHGQIELDHIAYIKWIPDRFNIESSKPVDTPDESSLKLSANPNKYEVNEEQNMERIHYYAILDAYCTNAYWMCNITIWSATLMPIGLLISTRDFHARATCSSYWNGAVTWHSGYQKTATKSTYGAEHMALSDEVAEALSPSYLLREIDGRQQKPIQIKCDNHSAINLVESDAYMAQSKHIGIKQLFIRDEISKGTIKVNYILTEHIVADLLTKSIPVAKLRLCTRGCGFGIVFLIWFKLLFNVEQIWEQFALLRNQLLLFSTPNEAGCDFFDIYKNDIDDNSKNTVANDEFVFHLFEIDIGFCRNFNAANRNNMFLRIPIKNESLTLNFLTLEILSTFFQIHSMKINGQLICLIDFEMDWINVFHQCE